jgi:hypothetical protein
MSRCVGIIVDGASDYAALRTRFADGFRILKTDGPRGHTARPADIAARSRKQIGILRAFRCTKVIVMLDFEDRRQAYPTFVGELSAAFSRDDFGLPVLVAVPNRMIENWYLADIQFLCGKRAFLRRGLRQKNYEGKDGKRHIQGCMRRGEHYSETRHGPEMFAILRFCIARRNSASFDAFLGSIAG